MSVELALVERVDAENPIEGDLRLTNGQFTLLSGAAGTAQHLRNRFKFFKGEWFLDGRLGIPFFEEVYIKSPRLNFLRALFRKVIETTTDINRVDSMTLSLNTGTRTLTLTFVAILEDGSILDSAEFAPFIVEV